MAQLKSLAVCLGSKALVFQEFKNGQQPLPSTRQQSMASTTPMAFLPHRSRRERQDPSLSRSAPLVTPSSIQPWSSTFFCSSPEIQCTIIYGRGFAQSRCLTSLSEFRSAQQSRQFARHPPFQDSAVTSDGQIDIVCVNCGRKQLERGQCPTSSSLLNDVPRLARAYGRHRCVNGYSRG